MTTEADFGNGVAKAAKAEVERTAARAARLLVTLAALFCVVILALIFVLLVGMARLQDYAHTNRKLNQQNARLLASQQQSGQFGILAVRCVLDQFALHRITNQSVHDHIAAALRVPSTPLTPLPPLPSDAQVAQDCDPFYRR